MPEAPTPTLAFAPPAVSVRDLTRRFGTTTVLDHLHLEIPQGEFVALLGHSGSGKTTLLRTLAGLDGAAAGVVQVAQPSTVVFQEPRLFPWKTVIDNVMIGLNGDGVRRRALEALSEVGLSHRLDAYPATLSGGEAQRAALARALVREPALLLLDEPFAALDALTRIRIHALVAELWKRHRPAVLLVTHDVTEAVQLADRALVLKEGRFGEAVTIDLPRPRRLGQPGFAEIRDRLLADLGVIA